MSTSVVTDLVRTGSGTSRTPDHWTCEAIALNMAALDYPRAEIDRLLEEVRRIV